MELAVAVTLWLEVGGGLCDTVGVLLAEEDREVLPLSLPVFDALGVCVIV